MPIDQLISGLSGLDIIKMFFKAFAIIFSLIYFFYAVIITKQTQVLTNTLSVQKSKLIVMISFFHIIMGILALILSIFLI
jgi:hypothetical protein